MPMLSFCFFYYLVHENSVESLRKWLVRCRLKFESDLQVSESKLQVFTSVMLKVKVKVEYSLWYHNSNITHGESI